MEIDQLIKELSPNVLSMEMIEREKLVPENLFELKIDGKILGPFALLFLKNFLEGKDLSNIMIKNLESIIWIPAHHHPLFFTGEVRKAPVSEAERREFYLLVNGRKVGPYKTEDIEYKVKNGELLFTDLISEDDGNHWCKLYEVSHVDLRKHQETELPDTPTQIVQTPSLHSEVQEQIGLVGDLVKVGLEGEKEKSKRFAEIETNIENRNKGPSPRFGNIFILAFILIVGLYFFTKKEPLETKEVVTPEKMERTPSSITPPKIVPKTSKDKPRKREIVRPPRYPVAPVQEQPIAEPSIQEDYVPDDIDLVDELPDEEAHTIKKPAPARRRSRPKPPMDENVDEPIEDVLDQ
jgi:hypothetical protein